MIYEPMSRDTHLARGYCCDSIPHCVFCPYREKPQLNYIYPWHELIEALKADKSTTIYTTKKSLVDTVTLMNKVTIIYNC